MSFDAVAATYDQSFTNYPLGRWLRQRVWDVLGEHFEPNSQVLELGCGTGEDACWLARRGVRVTATDASPAMLAVAQHKAAAAGLETRLSFARLDLRTITAEGALEALIPAAAKTTTCFAGAFSNFGALNCIPDRRNLAAALGRVLPPGAPLLLVLMGPFSISESLLHLLRGRFGTTLRRRRQGAQARLPTGAGVQVWYPSVQRLRRELEPWFLYRHSEGLGLLLPPSDHGALLERYPRFASALAAADRLSRGLPGAAWLSDHYLARFERR